MGDGPPAEAIFKRGAVLGEGGLSRGQLASRDLEEEVRPHGVSVVDRARPGGEDGRLTHRGGQPLGEL